MKSVSPTYTRFLVKFTSRCDGSPRVRLFLTETKARVFAALLHPDTHPSIVAQTFTRSGFTSAAEFGRSYES